MPKLTPAELQEARRKSGRLGGRPRKPTVEEARIAALEELVPKAVRVLRDHLDSDRADAWRAAVKVLEYGWGRPPDAPEEPADIHDADLSALTDAQLAALRQKLLDERPDLRAILGEAA